MSRFTIFTIILAVSVITVTMDLAVRDYFGEDQQASVLTDSEEDASSPKAEETEVKKIEPESSLAPEALPITPSPLPPAPEPLYTAKSPSSTITVEKVSASGFSAQLKEDHFNGKLYQLLDITKIPVQAISYYQLNENGTPIAGITEIALEDEIRALQMYVLLQNKTKPYIDLSLNETNAYGDRSFYINHAKKPDEAFLTVKIGRMIYGFAYVKTYHPELKKLIELMANG